MNKGFCVKVKLSQNDKENGYCGVESFNIYISFRSVSLSFNNNVNIDKRHSLFVKVWRIKIVLANKVTIDEHWLGTSGFDI